MLPLSALLLLVPSQDLQSLVDSAEPGGVVVVPPGVHRGPLRIDKRLTLEGRGLAVLDGGGSGTIVSAAGAPVTLRGLILRRSGDSFSDEDAGIRLEEASGSVVEDCRLEDVLFGLYISRSSRCVFRRLVITGKALPMPRRGDGVRLWYSDDTLLEHIDMADSRDFIIWFARGTVVRGCRVTRGRYGLHYMNCDDNDFEDNVFADNQVGGTIMYSRRIRMRNNRFERSRGPSAYGMLLKDADDVLVEGNAFVDNTRGIFFDNSPRSEDASCVIRRNLFALNDAGVALLPDTRRARFESNTFLDNLTHVEMLGRIDPGQNTWNGNHWGEHPALDMDGDGFGDVPYRPESVYENLTARHPELALLRFSPSVGAIELAGRLFPSTRGEMQLEDLRPSVRPTLPPAPGSGPPANPGILALSAALLLLPAGAAFWTRKVLR